MSNYIIIDTEGSGVFDYTKPADAPGQPRMAGLGMILTDADLNVEAEHGFLIRPDGWVFDDNSDAAKINGLTHERLMDEGVPAKDALRFYIDAIDARRVVGGYNVLHDLKQLRAELRYVDYPDRFMQTRYLCVMQGCRQIVDARTKDGRKKAPRLEEACAYFKIEREAAHTHLSDTRDALAILRKLRELGQMPAYKDPYDKEPKGSAPARKPRRRAPHQEVADQVAQQDARRSGRRYEQDVIAEELDFLLGASEDGK